MNRFQTAYYILRYLGPRFVWLRTRLHLSKALGLSRRKYAPRPWDTIDLAQITVPGTPADAEAYAHFKRRNPPPFLFPLGRPPEVPRVWREAETERQPHLEERLALLAEDRCVYFFRMPSPGPIDWHANAIGDGRSTPDKLWCDLPDFLPEQGDARTLWEPSRAAWAIDLARARSHGFEVDAGALFWHWLDSWMGACPPFMGFQWKCGQEASVRLIAIALAFWSLADDPATTPPRWIQFARLAWATGYRVCRHINYAISQKNNHAISEACGLLLVSHLFPEFRESPRWARLGRRILAQELRRQTYDDGTYLQHSMNYQRVMLHGALLGLRLAEIGGHPFERDLYDRLGRCGEFLFQMMEPTTGRLPQYGNNDGACVLPLNECDFNDYRPVIQATHFLVHRQRILSQGPWDEDLLWLFGDDALRGDDPPRRAPVSSAFDTGGYYTIRRGESWVMLRSHTYRDRPGHYDPLHMDLWWRGHNVLRDCGTYQYYVPGRPDVERYFTSIAAHNVVQVDDAVPVEFVSRFLFFPWPRARLRHHCPSPSDSIPFAWVEVEHCDYDRHPWHVLHRRTVIALAADAWVVVDDLIGDGEHRARLRWHTLDAPCEVNGKRCTAQLKTSAGVLFVHVSGRPSPPGEFQIIHGRDEPDRVQGFAAPYYGERFAVPTLEAAFRGTLPQRIITTLCPDRPLVPTPREAPPDRECWGFATNQQRWWIELSRPERRAVRTVLGGTGND